MVDKALPDVRTNRLLDNTRGGSRNGSGDDAEDGAMESVGILTLGTGLAPLDGDSG